MPKRGQTKTILGMLQKGMSWSEQKIHVYVQIYYHLALMLAKDVLLSCNQIPVSSKMIILIIWKYLLMNRMAIHLLSVLRLNRSWTWLPFLNMSMNTVYDLFQDMLVNMKNQYVLKPENICFVWTMLNKHENWKFWRNRCLFRCKLIRI